MGGVFDVGGDEGDQGFEVMVDVFREIISGAITARDDWATWDIRFV